MYRHKWDNRIKCWLLISTTNRSPHIYKKWCDVMWCEARRIKVWGAWQLRTPWLKAISLLDPRGFELASLAYQCNWKGACQDNNYTHNLLTMSGSVAQWYQSRPLIRGLRVQYSETSKVKSNLSSSSCIAAAITKSKIHQTSITV